MLKRVLLTGASGFLGKYVYRFLKQHYDNIDSLGRHANNDLKFDLQNDKIVVTEHYDLVVHLAGKAHSVPTNAEQKKEFFDVNVGGTINLLKGLSTSKLIPKSFIFISSVAVYGKQSGKNFNENTPLSATDAYGKSKIEAEKLVQEWCMVNNVICGILRLPLLAGENPPGNLGAMIKGIRIGYYFNIGGGGAKKSMVFADDVASILNKLAEVGGIYNLTDGYHPSFYELSQVIANQLNKNSILNIPKWLAKIAAGLGDIFASFPINSNKLLKITSNLTFDDSKARKYLNWQPNQILEKFVVIKPDPNRP